MRGPASIRCECNHHNDPWRLFCGGCGHQLEPACARCGFVNAGATDKFCGGCGIAMKPAVPVSPKLPARPAPNNATMPIDVIDEEIS
jgi:hypothetical protein